MYLSLTARALRSVIAFFLLIIAVSARAEVPVNITYLDSAGEGFFDNAPRTALLGNDGTTLGEQRRNALEAAVYHWSKLLNGSVPIRIKASWTSQGTSTLASASPLGFFRDWNGVPVAGRFYPAALANQLAGYDFDPSEDDIQVMCNPDWDDGTNAGSGDSRKWYYGMDGTPSGGDFDFYSTMLHELGHGLGFISFLNLDGTWQNGAATIYDNYLVNSSGNWVTSLSQAQRGAMVTSGSLFSAGGKTTSANYDQWAKIHAPSSYTPGSSLSHLDETTFSTARHVDECMTPVSSFATHNVGPVATGLFRDMGYTFVDNQAPSLAITLPANGSSRSGLTLASGTATDTSSAGEAGASGLREVRVTLWRQVGGNWYNWASDNWGGSTFDANLHIKKADASIVPIGKGTRSWAIALPTLPDGNYEMQAQAVDQMNIGSTWVKSAFTVDRSAPGISFDPWQPNDVVFDFAQLGGLAGDAATVQFAIHDITDAPTRFWNGAGWVTSENDYLPGSVIAGRWGPGATPLPARSQLRLGTYKVYAKALDSANNLSVTNITLTRSASDTTLPDVAITTPVTNQVFTVRSLPVFTGTAGDPESGIANVFVYLLRFSAEGILYWDGGAWNANASSVAASFNATSGAWETSGNLPGGTDLPNGTYQVQVTVQNGENPAGIRGTASNFLVDYHPTYTWTEGSFRDGVSGNENRLFNNPANWNPFGVPPSEAIVVINTGECDATPMGSLSIYGANIGGGKLTTPGMFVKKLNVSSGTLSGGAINIDGDAGVFEWTGGQVDGTVGILAGAVANVSGGSTKTLGSAAILNNNGTVNWSGSGNIYAMAFNLSDRATVNNHSNAVFNLLNDGTVFSSSYNPSTFNNLAGARFIKIGGSGQNEVNGFDFNNAGELRAETGTIAFGGVLSAVGGSRFTGTGRLLFKGYTFTAAGEMLVDGMLLSMESGTLSGAADFKLATTNNGIIEWSGGTITGEVEIAPGSVLNITGNSGKTIGSGSTVRNRGTINWSGSGDIYTMAYSMSDRATFRNMQGGSLNMSGTGRFSFSYNPSTFINDADATVSKLGAGVSGFDWVFNNNGSVQCSGGTMFFNAGGSHAGSFNAVSGSVIKFDGGAHLLADGAEWFGPGKYQLNNGTVSLNGKLLLGAGEAVTQVELASGALQGQGTLAGEAALIWSGGTIGGQLEFGPGLTVNVQGGSSKTFASDSLINNRGVFNWDGTGDLYAMAFQLTNRVVFNNLSNAVFNIQSNANFSASYNPSIFNNHAGGTLVKSGGGGTTQFAWDFNSFGSVHSSSGALTFVSGGVSGGSFTADTNGTVRFAGGNHILTNNTVLNGAGKIEIAGAIITHHGDVQMGTIETPATLEISSGGFGGSGALLGVATVNWTGGSIGGGRLDIPASVTFNLLGGTSKEFGANTVFNNSGTFNVTGSGTIYCSAYNSTNRTVFNNLSGAVFNLGRDGQVFQSSYNPSLFINHAGGLMIKSGGLGTNSLNSFEFVNQGELRVEQGTVIFDGKLDLAVGSVFSGTGAVKFAGAVLLDGTLQSSSHVTLESGTFVAVTNTAHTPTFSGTGGYEWTGGSIGGALTIASNVTFVVRGGNDKHLSSRTVFNNHGTVHWSGGNLYAMAPSGVSDRVVVHNRHGALWDWTGDANMTHSYSPSSFVNENGAVFRKSGGIGNASCSWDFHNQGVLELSSGNFVFAGEFTIGSSAVTKLLLSGTTSGSEYSQLARQGILNAAGELQVILKDNYIPTNGCSFNLVTYSSHSGQFIPVILPSLPSESRWELNYGETALAARVVPVTRIQNTARLANGYFEFTATGEAGGSLIVQASTDLLSWEAIATNDLFSGTLTFSDVQASTFTNRFYRIVITK